MMPMYLKTKLTAFIVTFYIIISFPIITLTEATGEALDYRVSLDSSVIDNSKMTLPPRVLGLFDNIKEQLKDLMAIIGSLLKIILSSLAIIISVSILVLVLKWVVWVRMAFLDIWKNLNNPKEKKVSWR